jgi:hypothetical protein
MKDKLDEMIRLLRSMPDGNELDSLELKLGDLVDIYELMPTLEELCELEDACNRIFKMHCYIAVQEARSMFNYLESPRIVL